MATGDNTQTHIGCLVDRLPVVNGQRIYNCVSDDTPTETDTALVLVPGLNVSSRHTLKLAELLAPYVRIYALDLPGTGKSDRPRRFLSLRANSGLLAEWIAALRLDHAVQFGASFSAQIVTDFAVRYPERVTRAVLASPTVDLSSRPLPKLVLRWRQNEHREPPMVGAATKHDYQDVNQLRALYTLWQKVSDHIEARLPDVRVPVLVARGDGDPIVSQARAEQMVRLLPNARLAVIPGGFHALTLDAPEGLANAIRDFLLRDQLGTVPRTA